MLSKHIWQTFISSEVRGGLLLWDLWPRRKLHSFYIARSAAIGWDQRQEDDKVRLCGRKTKSSLRIAYLHFVVSRANYFVRKPDLLGLTSPEHGFHACAALSRRFTLVQGLNQSFICYKFSFPWEVDENIWLVLLKMQNANGTASNSQRQHTTYDMFCGYAFLV